MFRSYASSFVDSQREVLSSTYHKFMGNRKPLPNSLKNYVKIYSWGPLAHLTGKHSTLEVLYNGQKYYLSFSPRSISELPTQSIFHLRNGITGEFKKSLQDEILIQGYRKLHLGKQEVQKLGNDAILNLIEKLSPAEKAELELIGRPAQTIELHSLNLEKIIAEIERLKKSSTLRWGAWSGAVFHQKDTFNCSSLVLHVLYQGDFKKLISTEHDKLGMWLGLLLAASSLAAHNTNLLGLITTFVEAFIAGRLLGGIYEGWTEIQSFLDLSAMEGKGNKCQGIVLRLASAAISGLVAVVKPGLVLADLFNTTPQLVMDLAGQAEHAETALYLHHESTPRALRP